MNEQYLPGVGCTQITQYNGDGEPFMRFFINEEDPHVEHYE